MKKELSARQIEILMFIKKFTEENHYSPTIREIGEHVKLKSTSSVQAHVNKLREKGYLVSCPSAQRTLIVAEEKEGELESLVEEFDLPSDVLVYIRKNPKVLEAIRAGMESGAGEREWRMMERLLRGEEYSPLVVAQLRLSRKIAEN